MRFASAHSTVILGLVAAAIAVPLGVDSDVTTRNLDASQHKARAFEDNSVFARTELLSFDTRGLKFDTYVDIVITYENESSHGPAIPARDALKQAEGLLRAAETKLGVKGTISLTATNKWEGAKNEPIFFTFTLPVCKGKCTAEASGGKEGTIIAQNKETIYAA